MIQKQTRLHCVDNTGAYVVECIHVHKKRRRAWALPGELINVAVKRLRKSVPKKKVTKGQVSTALVVGCRRQMKRAVGTYFKAHVNNCVLMEKDGKLPLGSRIFATVFFEVRERGFGKIAALARGVV